MEEDIDYDDDVVDRDYAVDKEDNGDSSDEDVETVAKVIYIFLILNNCICSQYRYPLFV